MARPGCARANVSATCLMAATDTPLSLETALTSMASTISPNRGSVRPSSTMTLRMARASCPSVPGALRIHWSAFDAVRDWRGSTWITVPARPSRKLCIRVKPRIGADALEPRLRPVRAEAQDDLGVLEGVVRDGVAAERLAIGGADGLVGERLEHRRAGRAPRAWVQRSKQGAGAARFELGHQRDAPALAALAELADPLRHGLDRVVPCEGPERAAVAALRTGEPIGIVEPLEARLTAHAERALAHGMLGIALELDHPPVAIAGEHAAARRALPAHRRVVGRDAGHHLGVGDDRGQDVLRRLLAAARRPPPRPRSSRS